MKVFGKKGEIMVISFDDKSLHRGSQELVVGESVGNVALTLPFVPTQVKLSVRKPVGGLGLVANVTGTPDITGFDFELANGVPEQSGYYLDYEVTG